MPLLADIALPPVSEPLAAASNGADDGTARIALGPGLQRLATATRARFTAIPAPPDSHPLVCDLAPLNGQLFASFAVQPIDVDGARVYRLDPNQRGDQRWQLALDWDRGGAPRVTHEVGGQGITRLRVIAGQLFAPDADAPLFGGFGLSDAPFEDYVFVSDTAGTFAPLGPGMGPPAGTRIVPLAFHTFDVIAYRGALVVSGGTVTPMRGRQGTRYPGGLFVGTPASALLLPRFFPGAGWRVGVVRTTYMHRFGGRLYIGFQNNGAHIRWDLAVLTGDPLDPDTPAPVLARVTPDGGWLTRRFASAAGTLYWIASGYRQDGRGSALYASTDGRSFAPIPLPAAAGAPQDLAIIGDTRYVLARHGLYRAGPDHRFTLLARAPPGDPFGRWNTFCSVPLVGFADALYAGSSRDGTVYRISASP